MGSYGPVSDITTEMGNFKNLNKNKKYLQSISTSKK